MTYAEISQAIMDAQSKWAERRNEALKPIDEELAAERKKLEGECEKLGHIIQVRAFLALTVPIECCAICGAKP